MEILRKKGHRWEKRFFGFSSANAPLAERKKWQQAILEVINAQAIMNWNPCEPCTEIASDIFSKLQKLLEQTNRSPSVLRLYCSLGLTLDQHYGIDGFFEYDGNMAAFDLKSWDPGERVNHRGIWILGPPQMEDLLSSSLELLSLIDRREMTIYDGRRSRT